MNVEIRTPKRATREEIVETIQELDEKYGLNFETSHVIIEGKKISLKKFLNHSTPTVKITSK